MDGNEVVYATGRRHFTDAYRIQVVEEAKRSTRPGELAAPMRRDGLYSLHANYAFAWTGPWAAD